MLTKNSPEPNFPANILYIPRYSVIRFLALCLLLGFGLNLLNQFFFLTLDETSILAQAEKDVNQVGLLQRGWD